MYLIDTHCHLDADTRFGDLETIFGSCTSQDVQKLICVGFDLKSSAESLKIAAQYAQASPQVRAAVGIHPHDASSAGPDAYAKLKAMLKDPNCVALGEIGLDYFYDNSPRDVQREAFCAQIELAREAKKLIVTHIRDAKERADGDANTESVQILRACGAEKVGGIIHCFSGHMEDAEAALEMGFYISFAGPVTYPKNEGLRAVAKNVPLNRILCETDSPYLAPQKFRGKKNEPANVRFVYEQIAQVRGISVEALAVAVSENVTRLFGWGQD
jgi:TatD DNase family protein